MIKSILIGVAIVVISAGVLASGKSLITSAVHTEKILTLKEVLTEIKDEIKGIRSDLKEFRQ